MDASTFSVTYAELATKLAITVPSAKTLVRRKRWPRTKGNDGKVRILVPRDYCNEDRHDSSHVSPQDSPHVSLPDGGQPAPGTIAAIAALERHVARLEADMTAATTALMSARSEADTMKAKALAEAVTSAAMKATLEAVTAERDRLLTREHLRESRPWWKKLAG